MTLRIGCLQMNSGPDVAANLRFIDEHLKVAAAEGVSLLQLPENFAQMPESARTQVKEVAGAGEIQSFLRDAAARHKINIIAGALPVLEKAESDKKPFARCLVINERGEQAAHYDKVHLFNVTLPDGSSYREADRFSPALKADPVVAEVAGIQVGLSICYDLRFPEFYRLQSLRGLDLISVPAAFTYASGKAHWNTLLRARAIENLSYVFAAAQCGEHAGGRRTWGHSVIFDPWGECLASAEHAPGLIFADFDRTTMQDQRQQFPALQHRRLG